MLSVLNSIALFLGYVFLIAIVFVGAWIVSELVYISDIIEYTIGRKMAWRYELWRRNRNNGLSDSYLDRLEEMADDDDIVELIRSYR